MMRRSRARSGARGVTLVEVVITVVIVGGIALTVMPFIRSARYILKKAQVKEMCSALVQNKLKDYRSSKLWGIAPASLGASGNQATGAYSTNSTFNWLKARYNLVTRVNPQGCLNLNVNPPTGANGAAFAANTYGLRENLDNHGGPTGVPASIPTVPAAQRIPANACPEQPGSACPGPGPTDLVIQQELSGFPLAVYVNLQIVSRAPRPNPWSRSLVIPGTNPVQPLAAAYNPAATTASQYVLPLNGGPPPTGCPGNLIPPAYPGDPANALYNGPVAASPTNPYPYIPQTCPPGGGAFLNEPSAALPGGGVPAIPTSPYPFTDSNVAIRVIVTGAIWSAAANANMFGYTANTPLPDGGFTNTEFLCQAEEVMAPEEPPFRYYVQNYQIYDFRGNLVFQSIPSNSTGSVITALAVSPDNRTVYVAYKGGVVNGFRFCGYGANPAGPLGPNGLDCPPQTPLSYTLGSTDINGLAVDFINFPDIFVTATASSGMVQSADFRFDPNANESLCGKWMPSLRFANRKIQIGNYDVNNTNAGSTDFSGMLITPMNDLLIVTNGTLHLVGDSPDDPNLGFPFFGFAGGSTNNVTAVSH